MPSALAIPSHSDAHARSATFGPSAQAVSGTPDVSNVAPRVPQLLLRGNAISFDSGRNWERLNAESATMAIGLLDYGAIDTSDELQDTLVELLCESGPGAVRIARTR